MAWYLPGFTLELQPGRGFDSVQGGDRQGHADAGLGLHLHGRC